MTSITPLTFTSELDIMNRALQHCGARRIASEGEDSKQWNECDFAYDKCRQAELRRNVWRFSIRRTVTRPLTQSTYLFTPATWSSGTFAQGAIVSYQGTIWISSKAGNSTTPGETGSNWVPYFGMLHVDQWNSPNTAAGAVANPVTAYYSGDLVYVPTTASMASVWSSSTTYASGNVVQDSYGYEWVSQVNSNQGVVPGQGPSGTASTGSPSMAADFWVRNPSQGLTCYLSLYSANSDEPPTNAWLAQSGTLTPFTILYPIGAGPTEQEFTRNVYPLPNGFLKEAPQDPKAGSTSFLGAPSGRMYDDWEFESGFFVTRDSQPITFRFVADCTDVSQFDPMFCEGLAARLALEVCEPLTQSTAKLQSIGAAYNRFMSEARVVNGIETGPTEPPEDDFITCRI